MRVLVAVAAEKPHFLGMVPLGWALRAAGHEVLVASQPELEPVVRATGLPYAGVGRDHALWRTMKAFDLHGAMGEAPLFGRVREPAERVPWEYLVDGYRRVVPWWWRLVNDPMADDLVDLCRAWRPDLVVWGAVTYAGAVAAEACGARHIRYLWGADLFARTRERFLSRRAEQPEDEREDPLAAWLTRIAARHGVEFSETLVNGHATIEQIPPALRLPARLRYMPVRYVPYNGRAAVPDWLRTPPARPRVCVTLGTTLMAQDRGDALFRDVLEGLADLDADVVATLPPAERERLGTVPPNARLVDHTSLHLLAATCDAMVDHGGWGTVLTAMDAGVPQVIVPHWFDNPMLAGMVAEEGAAISLDHGSLTPESTRAALDALLSDTSYRDGAVRLSEAMHAMPSPDRLAGELADLL
ncbi:activator-dependent family glycosyltransferase [Nocardiopsis deserti]|uniref:activator-dependent family glycosyltransferase n=1 Tax=Nocardiopsis deserti TaxID=2605988 RepID=UPI0012395665|nr:activator-dependent family glycosyltransferase [Nocardiopsis deserti]